MIPFFAQNDPWTPIDIDIIQEDLDDVRIATEALLDSALLIQQYSWCLAAFGVMAFAMLVYRWFLGNIWKGLHGERIR